MQRPGSIVFHSAIGRLIGLVLIASLALSAGLFSQQGSSESRGGYTMGSGDIVRITVIDEPDLSGLFRVSSIGQISYPYLGNIDVRNMTAEELNTYLMLKLMEDYLVNPVVTVSIESYMSKKVYVQGEVVKPGVYYLKEKTGILNLLLEAGGTTENASEEIVILRSDSTSFREEEGEFTQKKINLKDLLSGDLSQNIPVINGDIIYVANASGGQFRTEGRFINIMGEVKKPGNYDYRLGLTVLSVIMDAGGFTEYAAKNKVKVIKKVGDKQKVLISRLDDLVKKGRLEEDILLDPGDLVVVPQSLF